MGVEPLPYSAGIDGATRGGVDGATRGGVDGATRGAAASGVLPALQAAASRVGVDFATLLNTARLESGFNPNARARTSSATGLFQFIDSTWLSTLARHGREHGITPSSRAEALAMRRDPAIASLMAAELMADNARALSARLGRAVDGAELYLAHFLGVGGAARFLSAMATNPGMAAAELLPAAARANRAIFTNIQAGQSRSLAEVFDLLRARFTGSPGGSSAPVAATGGRASNASASSPGKPAITTIAKPVSAPPSAAEARRAAQAAYLLLAQLGGG